MTDADRLVLLGLARAALEAAVRGDMAPTIPPLPVCQRSVGAFVTLTLNSMLRGCIGYAEADRSLGEVIVHCAEGASQRDPRFPPVQSHELAQLRIELSVLDGLEPVASFSDIEVGRHGLVVQQGGRRGLLLPQVAIEWGWDREAFLGQTCVKAGLPCEAWRDGGAQVFRFEAEVFGEPERPAARARQRDDRRS